MISHFDTLLDVGQSIKLLQFLQYFGITSLGSGTSVAKWLRVYRAIGVRLLAVSLRLLLPLKFSGDNRTVVARRPHSGRTCTNHHLPLLCDQTGRRQVFEHVQKPNFGYAIGCRSEHKIIAIAIFWHHITWQWHECRKMVARLSCDWRAFTCGQFATTSALEV